MLIVNADDFGISEGVNAAVLEAHRLGILTSATIMVNTPGFEEAARLALENPTLGVGIHLNLTAGAPVLAPSQVPSLVNGSGCFPSGKVVLRRLSLRRLDPREMEAEFNAQMERAMGAGLTPTHLDSHHHLHLHPALQRETIELARRFGVRGIRCTVEMGPGEAVRRIGMVRNGGHPLPGGGPGIMQPRESPRGVYLKTAMLSLLGSILRGKALRAGLAAPVHFRGLLLGSGFTPGDLQRELRRLPRDGVTELMCHPGYPDEQLRRQTSYSDGRDRELRSLLEPAARRILEQAGVRLGSYSDLPR